MARPVFLAAPERGEGALGLVDKLLVEMQVATSGRLSPARVFVPHLQVGDSGVEVAAGEWFTRVLTALQEAAVVVAVLDGPDADENVAFLAGYAFAAGKPVVGFVTDRRTKGPLATGACVSVVHDLRGLVRELERLIART